MPSRSTTWLLVLAVLLSVPGASRADLKVTGTKDFQYRAFSITGSLNQFLVDHPTFLADRGFRQSLRLNVSGTLFDSVSLDIALDDTNDIEKDRKLLVSATGKDFGVTAGRLTLDFPGTRYLVFNKKALAAIVNYRHGAHTLSLMAGRPEGDGTRDFFRGLGARAEYLLTHKPVVQGSEIVVLDGRALARGGDYDMDYEEGTLILNRRLLPVEVTSSITVEYEAQSTGSAFRSTVVGIRDSVRLPAWSAWRRWAARVPPGPAGRRGVVHGVTTRRAAPAGAEGEPAGGGRDRRVPAGVGAGRSPASIPGSRAAGDLIAVLKERVGQVRGHVMVAVALAARGVLSPTHGRQPAKPGGPDGGGHVGSSGAGPRDMRPARPTSVPAPLARRASRGPVEPAVLANFGLPGAPVPEPAPPVPGGDDEDPGPPRAPTPASAVSPSPLADRGRIEPTLSGMAYGAQILAPGQYPGQGSSSFPGASNVPLPDAFGAGGDPGYADRRGFSPPVRIQDDHAGISFVLSTDSEGEESAAGALTSTSGTTVTSATPRQLGVLGADLAYRLGGGWRVSGEAAHSVLDPDRRTEGALSHGLAWDVALQHAGPRWDFRLSRQHLGPRFEAVGKREFARLGEVADLSSDLNLTTAHSRLDITRGLFLDSAVEVSETNLSGRADRPARNFLGLGNGLSLVFEPRGRVLLRHRDDVSDLSQAGLPRAHVTRRVRGAAVTKPLGRMVAQVRAEEVEDRGVERQLAGDTSTGTTGGRSGDTTSLAASLGDASRRRYKWNLNAQDVRFVDRADRALSDAISLSGLLDLSFSRFLNGSVSLLDRTEKNLVTSESQGTRTGEMRVRYQPFDGLNLNSKAAAEERSRIVRQTADPLLALVPQKPGERTLVAERPVVATNASHTADWQPSRHWDHRASYRTRDEREVGSGALISTNHAGGYRLRYAPGTVFRTTTEVEAGRSLSKVAGFDRDTWLLTEELLWSLSSGLNLSLSYNDSDAKDRVGPGRDRTTVTAGNAERTLGRYFTGLARLAHTDRIQGGSSGENAVGVGLRYALPHDPLRVQLDGEVAGVNGVNPAGAPFESRRHKAGVRVDGQPRKDVNVECAITWVRAGANALGDNGYNGWTIESKAFLDF